MPRGHPAGTGRGRTVPDRSGREAARRRGALRGKPPDGPPAPVVGTPRPETAARCPLRGGASAQKPISLQRPTSSLLRSARPCRSSVLRLATNARRTRLAGRHSMPALAYQLRWPGSRSRCGCMRS